MTGGAGHAGRWVVVVAALTMLMTGGSSTHTQDHQDDEWAPLPFDPLSRIEQQRALDVALADVGVRDLLSDHFEVIGASLHTDKAYLELDEWPRVAETWLYDHGSGLAVRAYVDLTAGTVEQVEGLQVQPPLTAKEVDRAGQAALADPSVQARLEEAGIETADIQWTARLWTGSGPTLCPVHRCALVGFMDEEAFVPDVLVVADLANETVHLLAPEAGVVP